MRWALDLAERGVVPDTAIRHGIRRLLARRLREVAEDARAGRTSAFIEEMNTSPIALDTDTANEQHYELPAEFFRTVLGPNLKYSSCLWPDGITDLAAAEERMLQVTCDRAGIQDGGDVLDLGCGWGSLSLWIATRYPKSKVLAVSNSSTQADFIRDRCASMGVESLEVVTADMNAFNTDRRFDRIVSIEMFEHMRNWPRLLGLVASWLKPDGAFFMHVFCHREHAYPYVDNGSSDWMARHFFTGGIMPSANLPHQFPEHLTVDRHWRVNGVHYSRTLEAWLEAMDAARDRLTPLFKSVYGEEANRWFGRWRIFFMACSELFRYRDGNEWLVSHYLMRPNE